MTFLSIISIGGGAAIGALVRWMLGLLLNPIFPSLHLGTLTANLIGGFLIGMVMALLQHYPTIPTVVRLASTTGFLGGLTTFSAFSAEATTLLTQQEYMWTSILVISHVGGTILATLVGLLTASLFLR